MTLGYPVTKQRIDAQVGDAVYRTREVLALWQRLKVDLIDDQTSQEQEALGYSPDEATRLRATVLAQSKLADIAHGQAVQAAPNDFFFDARHFTALS